MPPSRVRNTISQKGMRKIFLFFRASLFLQGMIFFMFIYQEGTFIYQEGTFISQKKLRENLGFIFYDAPSFTLHLFRAAHLRAIRSESIKTNPMGYPAMLRMEPWQWSEWSVPQHHRTQSLLCLCKKFADFSICKRNSESGSR